MKNPLQLHRKINWDWFIIGLAAVVTFLIGWSNLRVAAVVFGVWFILNPINSRIMAKISLGGLVLALFSVLIRQMDRGEQMAKFAFFFLALTCISIFYEEWKARKS